MKKQFVRKSASVLIISFTLGALFLSACKKDDDLKNDYKISFKANGVLEEFSSENSLSSLLLPNSLPNRLTVEAHTSSALIFLTVFDMKKITDTTYKGYTYQQYNTYVTISGAKVAYQKNKANFESEKKSTSDVTIIITEMTSKTVRGKFSAKVYGAEEVEIDITEGEFFAPLKISDSY